MKSNLMQMLGNKLKRLFYDLSYTCPALVGEIDPMITSFVAFKCILTLEEVVDPCLKLQYISGIWTW